MKHLVRDRDDPPLAKLNYWPQDEDFTPAWQERLLERADKVANGKLSFFGMPDVCLGDPIDWHRDHKHQKSAPRERSSRIDYRDFRVTGDCKFVWEPNRHHHLVVLAQAYRLTGDIRYASTAVEYLAGWFQQNPYGMGMNWRSPLELGIRLINMVWTIDLILDSGLIVDAFREQLMNAVHLHLWEISRKYSRGSSANNHLVGEAAGVFVGSSFFDALRRAPHWRSVSMQILCDEIGRQVYPDGGPREQALGYHRFILHLFLVAGMVGRKTACDFPPAFWAKLEKMFEFSAAMVEGGDEACNFGDCDDGYVLDLGGHQGDIRPWLAVAATLFGRPDFKAASGGFSQAAFWMLGPAGRSQYDAIRVPPDVGSIHSLQFPDSGYYLLQHGRRGQSDRLSVLFDCGELGLGPLAAHGHADALSVTVRAFGQDLLVDSGTYDYFSYPQWRRYFRSTPAHNTIAIDGRDQSEMLGLFQWGRRAAAKCLEWQPTPVGGRVVGQHDGYCALSDPVLHRRTVEMDASSRKITVQDDIVAKGSHQVVAYFHIAESCHVSRIRNNVYRIDTGGGSAMFRIAPQLTVTMLQGSTDPIGGWVSRGYHQKSPSTTLACRCDSWGDLRLECELTIGQPADDNIADRRKAQPALIVARQE